MTSTGLLWFDNDPSRTIAEKVIDAAERYAEKFGVAPTVCLASPRSIQNEISIPFGTGAIKIVPDKCILPNHFWIASEVIA